MSRAEDGWDVVVVGSGPAGTAAAFPLVEAGLRVLMLDGGEGPAARVPDAEFLETRRSSDRQWEWMVGREFESLRGAAGSSPKFRAPTLAYVFRGFADANRIAGDGFTPVGSLASGGLSNAWGCGVARFDAADLAAFPFAPEALDASFEAVARRIGVSGRGEDDLSGFFGVDAWAQAPIPMDALHERLLGTYARRRGRLVASGFRLGRARLAVLSEAVPGDRQPCSRQGFCLWGCARRSLYSAREELATLSGRPNFRHRPGVVVERLERIGGRWNVFRRGTPEPAATGRVVVLAAGTLATTAIVMRSLPGFEEAPLLSLPMAAFVLWLPDFFGAGRVPAPGTAQLAFTLDRVSGGSVCGFTFSTHGLPVAEFVRHAPLAKRNAVRLFRALLSSTVVANCFFPAEFSKNRVTRREDGGVRIVGLTRPDLGGEMENVRRRLRRAFRKTGALVVPGTFTPGLAGADAHYAGTVPMRRSPARGESGPDAEIRGLPGVHVADGAALPALPAKSHTLAIMACADRLGRLLADRLRAPAG